MLKFLINNLYAYKLQERSAPLIKEAYQDLKKKIRLFTSGLQPWLWKKDVNRCPPALSLDGCALLGFTSILLLNIKTSTVYIILTISLKL
uniref:Uncharacterized protein n=1 Tax=Pyxicephalus adspersus TaxID=30357 RepID=A0AAV3AYS9_PYXAD|nr:TPA: hypothetical protein GDO54_000360 [Pyxicephalus adspersus]